MDPKNSRLQFFLIFLLLTPPFLFYIGIASSLALGVFITASIFFGISFIFARKIHSFIKELLVLVVLCLFLVLHLAIASFFHKVNLDRFLISLMILCAIIFAASRLSKLLLSSRDDNIKFIIHTLAVALLTLGALGGLDIPTPNVFHKSVFPFAEPSHFALTLTPVLIAASAISILPIRLFYLGFSFVLVFVLESLTLGVGVALAALICLSFKQGIVVIISLLPAFFIADLSYFYDRLNLFDGTIENLSALVYLQGWHILSDSFFQSLGIGLGFQQLGLNHLDLEISQVIYALAGTPLNIYDGGFVLAKLGAELGVFSLPILFVYGIYLARSIYILREVTQQKNPISPAVVLGASAVAGYSVELMIRGAGYFTPTALLMLSGALCLAKLDTHVFRYRLYRKQIKPESLLLTKEPPS